MQKWLSINQAVEDLRKGRMVILVDSDREKEGDLVMAAEMVTPDAINFMAKYGKGLICLTLSEEIIERLQIPPMPERNKHPNQAAFTALIDARQGIGSGTSAYDRAHTIQVAINPLSTPNDISIPGHVFPLKACAGGVLTRQGHTEGSVDLAKLAGFQPAGVLCEMMGDDGNMATLSELRDFAAEHDLKLVTINDLIAYRKFHG